MAILGVTSTFSTVSPLMSMPKHTARGVARLLGRIAKLDAACLATPADVDLRLDDDRLAKLAGDLLGLAGRRGDLARLHGDAVPAQDLLRLVLMNLHRLDS